MFKANFDKSFDLKTTRLFMITVLLIILSLYLWQLEIKAYI